jgi:hypothetical protein
MLMAEMGPRAMRWRTVDNRSLRGTNVERKAHSRAGRSTWKSTDRKRTVRKHSGRNVPDARGRSPAK